MSLSEPLLVDYLMSVLRGVLQDLDVDENGPLRPDMRFADVVDSMAMVEFLGVVAEDCGCELSALEEAVDHRFSTVEQLARSMHRAGLAPRQQNDEPGAVSSPDAGDGGHVAARVRPQAARQLAELEAHRAAPHVARTVWLTGSALRLPQTIQPGPDMDAAVGRPVGWLERRAGILERRLWATEDPIEAAAGCAADTLRNTRTPRDRLGALIVVSEAPPLAVGLAASVHDRIGLSATTPCYELGGACTGFLSALALARSLLVQVSPILIVSVEAHSRLLPLELGPYGESAALFGDGCAAVLLDVESGLGPAMKLIDIETFTDGGASDLVRVQPRGTGSFCLEMDGVPLTEFALHALSSATRSIAAKYGINLNRLAAIVAHGGNGRMPAMLARLLHVPPTKVWSEVKMTGNLGSASVPVAWASRPAPPSGPVIWTAVGAGLVWGAALWESEKVES